MIDLQMLTRYTQLSHGQILYAYNINMGCIYKVMVDKVMTLGENREDIVIQFLTKEQGFAKLAPIRVKNISLNKLESPYTFATDIYKLKQLILQLLSERKQKFEKRLSEIKQNPTMVGTTPNNPNDSWLKLSYLELNTFLISDRYIRKIYVGYDLHNLNMGKLTSMYHITKDDGAIRLDKSYGAAPELTLEQADSNFFKLARKIFKERQTLILKMINRRIVEEERPAKQLELQFVETT